MPNQWKCHTKLARKSVSRLTDGFDMALTVWTAPYNFNSETPIYKKLTCFSVVIILKICLRMKLHPRNLSNGDKGTWMGSCCRPLGFKRLSNASWDKRVGMAAAQALWGRILDGGLITENKHINFENVTLDKRRYEVNIFLISSRKCMLWVLVWSFHGEIRKISVFFSRKRPDLVYFSTKIILIFFEIEYISTKIQVVGTH